jgi:hypothetical protein
LKAEGDQVSILMSSFCAKILLPKNYNPKSKHIKAAKKKLLYEKAACKILVKLTPGGRAICL